MKQFFSGVWQTAKVLYTTFSLAAVLALVILLLAFAESQEQDLSETLTITIVILVGAILAAAARATLVQSIFRNATGQRRMPTGQISVPYSKGTSSGFHM